MSEGERAPLFPPSVPRVLVRSLERRFLWVFLPLLLLPPRMALLLPVLAISAKLGCVNEAGEAVDWWFLYKHPRWTDASHKTCIGDCTGSTYVYSTSASPTTWTVGAHTVFEILQPAQHSEFAHGDHRNLRILHRLQCHPQRSERGIRLRITIRHEFRIHHRNALKNGV